MTSQSRWSHTTSWIYLPVFIIRIFLSFPRNRVKVLKLRFSVDPVKLFSQEIVRAYFLYVLEDPCCSGVGSEGLFWSSHNR